MDGWTDRCTHQHAGSAASCALCNHRGCSVPRHRVPVPISGPHPHPIATPSTRRSATKHPFVPGCWDGQHRASPGPDLPSPSQIPPPSHPSPGQDLPPAVPAGLWKWGRTAPGAPTAGPSACCGHPAPAGLSLRGAWRRPPPRSGGSGDGGAEPRCSSAPPQRSRPGSAQIGSARLGSARRGAVHAAPPQLWGGEEDWGGGERRMPGLAPRGWAVPTHQPPSSPALTPLRSGDAAPGPERLRSSACNVVLPCALAAFRTRKPSSSSSSAQCCVWETSSETGAALYTG